MLRYVVSLFAIGGLSAASLTMATWAEGNDSTPYYSIYNGTTWSTPAAISDVLATTDVFAAHDPSTGKTVATWGENDNGYPYFAVYNGSNWSTAQAISSNTAFTAYSGEVFICLNSTDHTFMAVWADNSSYDPYYAIYNGSSWTTPAPIVSGLTTQSYNYVFACYSPTLNQTIAIWADRSSTDTYYSFYNGSSWSTPGHMGRLDSRANDDGYPAYNPVTGDITVTYGDQDMIDPTEFTFDGVTPGTPVQISSNAARDNVFVNYNPISNQMVAVWAGFSTRYPTFSVYNGSSWSVPASIVETTAQNNIFVSYNPTLRTMIATWGNFSDGYPYFATYNGTSWSAATPISSDGFEVASMAATTLNGFLEPPTNFHGVQQKNDFGTVHEMYNQLSWTVSSSPGVAGYYVYASGAKIATLGANITNYRNHNIVKNATVSYAITSFTANGSESDQATTVVSSN